MLKQVSFQETVTPAGAKSENSRVANFKKLKRKNFL